MLLYHGELNKNVMQTKEKKLPKEKSHNNSIPQVRDVHKIHVTVLPLIFTFHFLGEKNSKKTKQNIKTLLNIALCVQ